MIDEDETALANAAPPEARREPEPVAAPARHERQASWLQLSQSLPELIDRTLPMDQTYIRLGRELVVGLRLQRVAFFEIVAHNGVRALRPIGGPGIMRPLGAGASLLATKRAGICNDPAEPGVA